MTTFDQSAAICLRFCRKGSNLFYLFLSCFNNRNFSNQKRQVRLMFLVTFESKTFVTTFNSYDFRCRDLEKDNDFFSLCRSQLDCKLIYFNYLCLIFSVSIWYSLSLGFSFGQDKVAVGIPFKDTKRLIF